MLKELVGDEVRHHLSPLYCVDKDLELSFLLSILAGSSKYLGRYQCMIALRCVHHLVPALEHDPDTRPSRRFLNLK